MSVDLCRPFGTRRETFRSGIESLRGSPPLWKSFVVVEELRLRQSGRRFARSGPSAEALGYIRSSLRDFHVLGYESIPPLRGCFELQTSSAKLFRVAEVLRIGIENKEQN